MVVEDTWLPLTRLDKPLRSQVEGDTITTEACAEFDYALDHADFYPWSVPSLPNEWGIGLIVGASGSGKSLLLKEFGTITTPEWQTNKSIVSHFSDAQKAMEMMYAVGLSAVPTWTKPHSVLSTGEKFRADLARQLYDGAIIDEFTSVVDRTVAKATSNTFQKYVRTNSVHNIVLASCHRDIIPWLQPDWIIDTDAGMFCIRPRECLQREPMVAEVYEVSGAMWSHFVEHHYLVRSLNPSSTCFLAVIDGTPAGFGAVLSFPSGTIKNARRAHRIVVKPEFQGLGLGVRLSDWKAKYFSNAGYRYFSKTTHPRLGQYRDNSTLWKPTSKNHIKRKDTVITPDRIKKYAGWQPSRRMSYSHEFISDFATNPATQHQTLETPLHLQIQGEPPL